MTGPHLQRVADIATDGRIYVAVGLFAALVALVGVAWWLGRVERREKGQDR